MAYIKYIGDWRRYNRLALSNSQPTLKIINAFPAIHDSHVKTSFDPHYLYQDCWAAKKIIESGVRHHVDVASRLDFVGFLSQLIKVTFIDIRPPELKLPNVELKKGSILELPYADGDLQSLSCLHVAEHIGLGRYGDPLDAQGTLKSLRELARVLAPGGNLYFSTPVGRERVCFNAHRIHRPSTILKEFSGLQLQEFSGVDDRHEFHSNADPMAFENGEYCCGMFWMKKPK